MRSRPRLLQFNCIYGGADRWGSSFSVLVGQEGGCWGAEERSAVQCGAGEGEDFDGGREGVALDRHLTASGKWDVQVMLQSRTVLGTQAAREEAAQERWLLAAGQGFLQHLAIIGAREHRRGRAIVFPVSCSNSIHTGDLYSSSALRSLHVMAFLHDGVPLLHVPNGDDALLASLWSRDCIFAPEAGTRPSSNSGQ